MGAKVTFTSLAADMASYIVETTQENPKAKFLVIVPNHLAESICVHLKETPNFEAVLPKDMNFYSVRDEKGTPISFVEFGEGDEEIFAGISEKSIHVVSFEGYINDRAKIVLSGVVMVDEKSSLSVFEGITQNNIYDADLVGLDIETGGLDGYQELDSGERVHGALYRPILEVGIVLPMAQMCGHTIVTESRQLRVGIAITDDVLERCDPWALKQHQKSGLLDAIRNGDESFNYIAKDTEDAERFILGWLEERGVRPFDRKLQSGAMVFGNNIGFDMNFIGAQMPTLSRFFCYRKIDVSTVNILTRTIWKDHHFIQTNKELEHTALNDIKETMTELNGYTKSLNQISRTIS